MSKKATIAKNNEEKIYEVGYHLISSIAEEGIPDEVSKIKDFLAKENAIILSEETPKLRPLAYSIKKSFEGAYKTYDKAYFGFIKFELPEDGDIKKIEANLKNNTNILRYLVIKTVRENTMYSPKISIFTDKEEKVRVSSKPVKSEISKDDTPATVEEMDKSIDALVKDEVKV